jgi:cytochrome c-type biogenesis protein CcsB
MVQSGGLLKIFPDRDDPHGKWLAVSELMGEDHAVKDTLAQVFLLYAQAVGDGNNELASQLVSSMQVYQTNNCDFDLSEGKKKAEIMYNKFGLFDKLARFYGLFGIILLVMQFLRIFRPRKWVEWMFVVGVIHLTVAFILHTFGLGLRWYISGHAPLSNGYESMIFVSWISLLAGLIFARRTGFAIALTGILSALSLLVAHMSWMNPDITNLVPVLKSPWLTIHVTVIMAGYAFLGLSMLMGLMNQVFYIVANRRNKSRLEVIIEQLTKVNHLSLIIGLYFLTVGTFLGGVWANESWGRYWGWDPKETWALISIFVYAFIAHMHRIPGMRGNYAFNVASVFGFFSIMMTYFGVNYFLGGIHSYAGGAAFTMPWWVYLSVLSLFVVAVVSSGKNRKYFIEASE